MTEIEGLVSISIPFYNSERFLGEAIESVLSQTYTNWELLLVDDGSTDRSSEIARKYAAGSQGQIRYLEHTEHRNCGVNCSRNLGAYNSKGEYLAFLDSDDVWLGQKLEDQIAMMSAHPEAGIVFGPTEYWFDWDRDGNNRQQNYIPLMAPGGQLYSPPILLTRSYPLGQYGAPCPSSFLIRRDAFERINAFDECFNPRTYQQYEDIAFLTKIYLNLSVLVSKSCLDRNRCNRFSMSHRLAGTNHEELARRYYFDWLRQYLRQCKIVDPNIWRAVRRQSWFYWIPLPVIATKLLRRIAARLSRLVGRGIDGA